LQHKQVSQAGAAVAPLWRPRAALAIVVLHFSLFGFLSGVKGVIWADLLAALALGEGRFGSAQLVSPLVATFVLLRYTPLTARFGPKRLTLVGLAIAAIALVVLARVTSAWGFLGSLALLGVGTSLLDGAMNQTAIDWEQATGRRMMNFIHACFSSGGVLGALGAGLGLGAGLSYPQELQLLALVYALAALATWWTRYPPAEAATDTAQTGAWRPILRNPTLRALVAICGLSIVFESVVFIWSVIYVRNDLGAPVVVGSAAFALFNGAMFVGRLFNGPIVALRGARASLIVSGGLLIAGTALLVSTLNVWLAIGAMLVLGIAIAGIFPTVVAAAGAVLPGQSGALTGVIMIVTYVCFTAPPPVIGWVAEWTSLRIALSLMGLCGVAILWLAWRLDPAEVEQARS
jgi:fucose permease